MKRLVHTLLALTLLALGGACGGSSQNDPPPIYTPPEGEEDPQAQTEPEPEPEHSSEAEALNVALALAEAEGHNIEDYSDIVVHKNDDQDWVVQLRRPRMHRFLEVVVDHRTGSGDLSIRTSGHH